MGQVQVRRQWDLLALMEPGPALPGAARAALVPLMAALLLEAVEAERARAGGPGTVVEREGRDGQDRA